jgi:long-chain acyl-CoA synthetase
VLRSFKHKVNSFPAVNTLFNGLANHPDFNTVDWSHLKIGGGMAVTSAWLLAAKNRPDLWAMACRKPRPRPVAIRPTAKPHRHDRRDSGNLVQAAGRRRRRPASLARYQGPQVMAGYWQRPDETTRS